MFKKSGRSRSAESGSVSSGGRSRLGSPERLDMDPSFTAAEDRIRALGQVTDELDKAKIDGDVLDETLKNLFDKYRKEMTKTAPSFDANKVLFANCRNNKDIVPPTCLTDNTKRSDLDRISKLQRLFTTVPTYTNTEGYSIREFLQSMNSVVENLGFDVSEKEFEMLLLGRLAPSVKTIMSTYRTDSLESLYGNLMNLYDLSESRKDAFSSLVNHKGKYATLRAYIEDTLRLLALSGKSSQNQSQLFIHSLENVLPVRINDKLTDFCESYEALNHRYPSLPQMVDYICRYKTEIDKEFTKRMGKDNSRSYNFNQTEEPKKADKEKTEKYCNTCLKSNHNTSQCFKTSQCPNCHKVGHGAQWCPEKRPTCTKCGRFGHESSNCSSRCRLCNSKLHTSVTCPKYPGIEPVQQLTA